jgi:hypothetical protein
LILAIFAVVVARAVRTSPGVRCRCFGSSGTTLRGAQVARNLALAVIAAGGAVLAAGYAPESTVDLAGAFAATTIAVVVLMLVAAFDDLVELFAPADEPVWRDL